MQFIRIIATFIWLLALCCFTNISTNKMKTDSVLTCKHGGLAFIYRDKHTVEIKESGQKQPFEYLVCTIHIRGTLMTLAIIYHPPYSTANQVTIPMFIDEFTQFHPGILVKYTNVITLSDFNLHLDTTDPDAAIFMLNFSGYWMLMHRS